MSDKSVKTLPFWETIVRSFKYVLKNKKLMLALLPIVGVLLAIQIGLNLPLMCSYGERFCVKNWQNIVSSIIIVVAVVGTIINYCRSIICKEKVDFTSISFFKRILFYFLWAFLLSLVMGIPLGIFSAITSVITDDINVIFTLTLFFVFVMGTFLAPLIVAFPAISVDDYKIVKISKLFSMAKGNKMSIFFGLFIMMMPCILLSNAFRYLYNMIAIENYIVNVCFIFIRLYISLLDASFKGAFFAHVYQFLKYYDKDK